MSQENFAGTAPVSFTAGGTITRGQALVFSAAPKTVVASTAITQQVIGVALQGAASGEQVPAVTASGTIVTMVAGAAITAGAEVMPQATGPGKVITAAGATALSCGIALTAAAADLDLIEVLFRPSVKSPANA
jgi:hypothetical protein